MMRSELLATLARRTNKNTTLDSNTQSRLVDFLNETQREVCSVSGAERLRYALTTITLSANQTEYGINDCARILRMTDRTNDRALEELSPDAVAQIMPDPTAVTGTPTHYYWRGTRAVALDPSDSSTLYAKSNNVADTTQTVYVEGGATGNLPVSSSVQLNGTTAVALPTYSYTRVNRFYLSATAAGFVSLYEDSGSGTELATIPPGYYTNLYSWIGFYPTPSASGTIHVEIERSIADLGQTTSAPDLPIEFHDLLIYGAMMREYEHMDDARADIAGQRYRQRLGQFKYWLAETATGTAATMAPPSRLGAWYPAGT